MTAAEISRTIEILNIAARALNRGNEPIAEQVRIAGQCYQQAFKLESWLEDFEVELEDTGEEA